MLYNTTNLPKNIPLSRVLKADQIRRYSAPVDLTDTSKVQELIQKMIRACVVNNGVGFAAPQIGVFRRVFIAMESPGVFRAYINPSYKAEGTRKVEDFEACLSVPGKKVKVARFELISVSWTEINPDGTVQEMSANLEGHEARVFLHELDHLDGITILERSRR